MSGKIFAVAMVLLLRCVAVSAQDGSYYVVIGAFEVEENARKLIDYAQRLNVAATYSFNEQQKLYYVFVRNTYNQAHAYTTVNDMQAEGFGDAWVFRGTLAGLPVPVTSRLEPPMPDEPVGDVVAQEADLAEEDETEEVDEPEPVAVVKPVGKPFVFRLINDATGATVAGLVRLQETERSNQFRPYNANETVYLVHPGNRDGEWYVTCHVIGFRSYRTPVNYDNPRDNRDVEIGPGDEIILAMRLKRVKRGDYIEMDQVKFFNNSAILTPVSRRSLTELLAMMQENPDYRIRLHGHTNGNDDSEIVALGQSDDLFALTGLNERRGASARELSELRAETVKRFLEANGVDGGRIDVKGEGGKQPIFDPRGTNAGGNDRVEVEVTRH